jgi:hypothetical protein
MRELRNIRSADDRVLEHLCLSASKDGAVVFDRAKMGRPKERAAQGSEV